MAGASLKTTAVTRAESPPPAYVLTAGHCISLLNPNDILRDVPRTTGSVTFNFFYDTRDRQRTVSVKSIPDSPLISSSCAWSSAPTTAQPA